ncbi:pyridoxamine 5'-phosphate oxidase family protein [Pedococcus sp.]|jgi:nitroimidazol reductase NimA-like FMN-containing flavoprotein (pyridoxamine 5'-phosphate oxidase superfamily)|uniref:pyridoxamine 5'-phosphate oxidase family protein n=1 Tax=Pedococcus sp. TaxID=2860345 RepID=UPI002E1203CA|nr:pyridoxamine 5'-phosphate oxidase family protein [Pedococcus sp.]
MSTNTPGDTGATRELPRDEALALLQEAPVGRLAVFVGGRPDIFPVNHVVDRGSILFRTAHGRKLWGSAGLPVAFEADGYDVATGEAWSVVVHGQGVVVANPDEVLSALELPILPWQSGEKPRLVRISPEEVTGRRFRVVGGVRSEPPA